MNGNYDVIIIGGGVVGSAIARELSKYQIDIALIEKECDVAMGTSGRNSGVVHAGFNCTAGTLKARLCVEGCKRFEIFCTELGVPYRKDGKLVVAFNDADIKGLNKLMDVGLKNGVEGLEIIDRDRIEELEPGIGGVKALYSPWTAVTDPHLLTIALAENAAVNGVAFYLETEVKGIAKKDGMFVLRTSKGVFKSKYLVNSAGLFSDKIAAMAGVKGYTIYPCRGEYFILDKRVKSILKRPVYPVPRPDEGGLGVHLTTTVDGNILIGPSAEYIRSREDYKTTRGVMDQLYKEAKELLPLIEKQDFIRDYSGVRPKLVGKTTGGFGDFVIEESKEVSNLVNLIGIESPGLTCSPVIGEMVARMINDMEGLKPKDSFKARPLAKKRFSELSFEEKQKLIEKDPDYGEIVCRCEGITLKEIRDALNNPLGVRTVAGVKFRTRAMMGRCQGGYCFTRIIDLIQKKYNLSPKEIRFSKDGSYLFTGNVK